MLVMQQLLNVTDWVLWTVLEKGTGDNEKCLTGSPCKGIMSPSLVLVEMHMQFMPAKPHINHLNHGDRLLPTEEPSLYPVAPFWHGHSPTTFFVQMEALHRKSLKHQLKDSIT